MVLMKVAPGKTFADVSRFMQASSGTPPFKEIGGMAGLAAGKSGIMELNLTAGTYVAICFLSDPKSGQPHFMLGMMTPFTVSAAAAGPSMLPNTGAAANPATLPVLAGLAGLLLVAGGLVGRRRVHVSRLPLQQGNASGPRCRAGPARALPP